MSKRKPLTDEQLDGIWKEMLKPEAKTPPRLDRSAWKPCEACKTEKITIHIPAFRAMAVCNQHMDHGAFDLTLHLNFCPYCGRPLIDAAWKMLEKRLEDAK